MSREPPDKTAEDGRDPETGRFLPGNSGGPGRPRGLDFRRVVAERAAAAGIPLEAAVWSIFTSLLRRARDGDVHAAKLTLDRLCDNDRADVYHQGGISIVLDTGVPRRLEA